MCSLWISFLFQIWYGNVPHPKLVDYKKDQHWVVKSGDYLVFPGGGTQFKVGVTHYIESVEKVVNFHTLLYFLRRFLSGCNDSVYFCFMVPFVHLLGLSFRLMLNKVKISPRLILENRKLNIDLESS